MKSRASSQDEAVGATDLANILSLAQAIKDDGKGQKILEDLLHSIDKNTLTMQQLAEEMRKKNRSQPDNSKV